MGGRRYRRAVRAERGRGSAARDGDGRRREGEGAHAVICPKAERGSAPPISEAVMKPYETKAHVCAGEESRRGERRRRAGEESGGERR